MELCPNEFVACRHSHRLRHLFLTAFILVATALLPCSAFGQDVTVPGKDIVVEPAATPRPSLIVIGFAGGFIKRDSIVHGEVALAAELRKKYGPAMQAEIFENHHGDEAHKEILRLIGDADGKLSAEKKSSARIILYGHSWGASEADAVARMLQRDSIPVLLLVEVDGVKKLGEDDGVIPANVAAAINFYQTEGILHGRSKIRAADPAATKILGNVHLAYNKKNAVSVPRLLPQGTPRYLFTVILTLRSRTTHKYGGTWRR